MRILLLRHGSTLWNEQGLYQGRKDIELSQGGVDKLSQLRLPEQYSNWQVVSSPLQRASRTAELLTRRKPLLEPAFVEVDFGQWEGRSIKENRARLKAEGKWGWANKPPAGESYREVLERLVPGLHRLNQDSVIVTHRGVILTMIAAAWGWDIESKAPVKIQWDCLHLLDFDQKNEALNVLELNIPFAFLTTDSE